MIPFYQNPFFWALLSMLGMACAISLFNKNKLNKNPIFIAVTLILVTAGRIILVLPFCKQPRVDMNGLNWIIGGIIFATAMLIAAGPLFLVRWWSPPKKDMKLRTTGIYGIVRHPIYLCEVLWCLGLAIMFRSIYGIALTPIWWFVFLIHALAEETELERVLGSKYLEYKKKVRGRIFPGLPF